MSEPAPTSMELTDYKNVTSMEGNPSSIWTMNCLRTDQDYYRAAFIGSVDGFDSNLACSKVETKIFSVTPTASYAKDRVELIATFIPQWKLDLLQPNRPFRIQRDSQVECMTLAAVNGKVGVEWSDGDPVVPGTATAFVKYNVQKIRLVGCRSSLNSASYDSIVGKVNSDTCDGVAAGYMMCTGWQSKPRVTELGVLTNDIVIEFEKRSVEWNKFYKPNDGDGAGKEAGWKYLYIAGTTTKMYSTAAMSGYFPT